MLYNSRFFAAASRLLLFGGFLGAFFGFYSFKLHDGMSRCIGVCVLMYACKQLLYAHRPTKLHFTAHTC